MGSPSTLVVDNEIVSCCAPLADQSISVLQAEEVARIYAALADPVRLRLFSLLASSGELCSCYLEGPLEKSQPTVSHHTKILAEAGLIIGEKRGRWVWWRVVPERMREAATLLKI